MDAATLFVVMTFATGAVDTATYGYRTLAQCEKLAAELRANPYPMPSGVTSEVYCVKHIWIAR